MKHKSCEDKGEWYHMDSRFISRVDYDGYSVVTYQCNICHVIYKEIVDIQYKNSNKNNPQ
jgi:hypothetical protein